MATITTPFNGTEDTATVKTRLEAIIAYWSSVDPDTFTEWGDVRDNLNVMLATGDKMRDNEIAASFILKLNGLNDPESQYIADAIAELRSATSFVGSAAKTATIFQADGVTPVSAADQAVSLMADAFEGLELGPELRGDGVVGQIGSPSPAPTYDASTGTVRIVRVDGSNAGGARIPVGAAGKVLLVRYSVGSGTGNVNIRGSSFAGTTIGAAAALAGAGAVSNVVTSDTTDIYITAN
jgi:hypothetical protein